MEETHIYCFKCGAENISGSSRFCHMCGARLVTPEIEEYIRTYRPASAPLSSDRANEIEGSVQTLSAADAPAPARVQDSESDNSGISETTSSIGAVCPKCGARNDPEDTFCSECGARISALDEQADSTAILAEPSAEHSALIGDPARVVRKCPDCGAENDPEDVFCCGCGARLPSTDESREESAQKNETEPQHESGKAELIRSRRSADEEVPENAAVFCMQCGAKNNREDEFCHACGVALPPAEDTHEPEISSRHGAAELTADAAVEEKADAPIEEYGDEAISKVCMRCGASNSSEDAFCHACGATLHEQEKQPSETNEHRAAEMVSQENSTQSPSTCPRCGAETDPDSAFCNQCGLPLSPSAPDTANASGAVCSSCGASNLNGDAFCFNCGTRLS